MESLSRIFAILACAVLGGFSFAGLLSPFLSSPAQISMFEVAAVVIGTGLMVREIALMPSERIER